MTVAELIIELQKYPPETEVYSNDYESYDRPIHKVSSVKRTSDATIDSVVILFIGGIA